MVFVMPERRGSEIAGDIMDHAFKRALKGCCRPSWHCYRKMHGLCGLYEPLCFCT